MTKTKSKVSYRLLLEYCEIDSVCGTCKTMVCRGNDRQIAREGGEVVLVEINSPTAEYAQFCDLCECRLGGEVSHEAKIS